MILSASFRLDKQRISKLLLDSLNSLNSSRPADYVIGEITHKGQKVSHIEGSYIGWIRIDGNKYYDHRYVKPFKVSISNNPPHLHLA